MPLPWLEQELLDQSGGAIACYHVLDVLFLLEALLGDKVSLIAGDTLSEPRTVPLAPSSATATDGLKGRDKLVSPESEAERFD